ncbi:MAG: hypothetical protein QXZ02_05110 [Candidatus Bathyarchaeia archaeon]
MKEKSKNVARLLYDFYNSIEQRSPIFLTDKVFPKILDWKLITWESCWATFGNKEKRNDVVEWFEMERVLDMIITKIGERALEYGHWLFSTLLLEHFKNHVKNNMDKQIIVRARKRYTEDLFRLFCKLMFEKVAGSDESDYFWSVFPYDWKVTKNNLLDENNRIARILWNIFQGWAMNRIISSQTFDKQLNDVVKNLFPELHTETWGVVLIFVFFPPSPGNRVKSVIERPWPFIYRVRTFAFYGERKLEEVMEEQKAREEIELKNTYELALLLFGEVFTRELLKEYIKQANELRYPEDSPENHKRNHLLQLFSGLLKALEKI